MVAPELAQDVYVKAANKITNFRSSSFFLEHENLAIFETGFEAIAEFLLDRPLMLVNDALNKNGILQMLEAEWIEAEYAKNMEGKDELYAELGDTVFFGLLAGMLFWDQMEEVEKEFVNDSIKWSIRKGNENRMNLVDSVVYVAGRKDPTNYPEQFYQLKDNEEASQVNDRYRGIGKILRGIRPKLNAEWKETDDIVNLLAYRWTQGSPEGDIEMEQIEQLFAIANIDLLAQIEELITPEGEFVLPKKKENIKGRLFDQLKIDVNYLVKSFNSSKWAQVVDAMRHSIIERLIPVSESGIRNIAVAKFAETSGLELIDIPGSERELSWKQYLSKYVKKRKRKPDLIEYQLFVAWSKHNRLRRMTESDLEAHGVFTQDHKEKRTAVVAFDTIIQIWDGEKYVRGEKPESEEEAIKTITSLINGEPFLVSTVARVQNTLHNYQVGSSATLIPVRVVVRDRFEREELLANWIKLYRQIAKNKAKPWKLTPAGPSLMHPSIQKFLEVGVGIDLNENVLPKDFDTFDHVPSSGADEHQPTNYMDIGPLAYKKFADKLAARVGYHKMTELDPEIMQQVGMVFSGYSDVGMLVALENYLSKLGNMGHDPYSIYRDRKLMAMTDGDD